MLITRLLLILAASGLTACGDSSPLPAPTSVPPPAPTPTAVAPSKTSVAMSIATTKTLRFTWQDGSDVLHYKLMENPDGSSGFTQVGSNIALGTQSLDHAIALYGRLNARYLLQSCNAVGCTDSDTIQLSGAELLNAIGVFKSSKPEVDDLFGHRVSLSEDGNTLAVGAYREDDGTAGINQADDDSDESNAGAVYVFTRNTAGTWSQQSRIKSARPQANDLFGYALSLSADGSTLAVGAYGEDDASAGINQPDDDDGILGAGAAYVFVRDAGGNWTQQSIIKSSQPQVGDFFGISLSLAADGNTLAVGATSEDDATAGINQADNDDGASDSGAAYVFTRDPAGAWTQQSRIKSSKPQANDQFSHALHLSADGNTLAVGAYGETDASPGINQPDDDANATNAGAAYVFTRDGGGTWTQQSVIKSSNPEASDFFAFALSLSANGDTLAVGAYGESDASAGINQPDDDGNANSSGSAYVFIRDGSGTWSQQSVIKSSKPETSDGFGAAISLSNDGNTLAISAEFEDDASAGVGQTDDDSNASGAGAAYVFTRNAGGTWAQQSTIKSSKPQTDDQFGVALSLSGDGKTLAVGAFAEDEATAGIGQADDDDAASASGAVYIF